jgi:mono/diheme cytochrome c family protein
MNMPRLIIAFTAVLAIFGGVSARFTSAATPVNQAYYSSDQAKRGKLLYSQNCSKCHQENLQGNCPGEKVSASLPYVCATRGSAPPLVGDAFMQRWYSAGDLYSRVRWSMPADNVGGLSADDNLAIVAYLLQANGLPAGKALRDDVVALKGMALKEKSSAPSKVENPVNDLGVSEAYYTADQAERGKNYYYAACGMCHTAEASGPNGLDMPHDSGLGWHWGNQWRYAVQAGDRWLQTNSRISGKPQMWDTVADLYNKIKTTQPVYNINGLSNEEYVCIVAYLLKQNGFPSGKDELVDSVNMMRNMTMEQGYERLFNGKDLTGWDFVLGANCPPKTEGGCAQTNAGATFTVEDGIIYDTGTPHGYMYPKKKFGPDFTLRVEYRYVPAPGVTEDQDFYGNSGYLLFINKHDVWPRTLEIQGRTNMEMSINAMDGHATYTFDDELRKKVRNPAGQWNAVEIVSKGNEVWNYLNGTLLSHVSQHDFPATGFIGIQAESGTMQYRNMRIKPN